MEHSIERKLAQRQIKLQWRMVNAPPYLFKDKSSMNILGIDKSSAYRTEDFTDDKAGAIVRLVPVTADGTQDPSRLERFIGKTNMQTNHGQVEIRFEIRAMSLEDAFDKWKDALQAQIDEMNSQATRARIVNGAVLSPSQAKALARGKKP
jgi:hypothetical protein